MRSSSPKSETAFRTIGEVSTDLGIPQHVLRYWESRFPQVKPLQRAGNRRYYRPDDIALLRRIQRLLDHEGYSIRGVQKLLASKTEQVPEAVATPAPASVPAEPAMAAPPSSPAMRDMLIEIRQLLADALARA